MCTFTVLVGIVFVSTLGQVALSGGHHGGFGGVHYNVVGVGGGGGHAFGFLGAHPIASFGGIGSTHVISGDSHIVNSVILIHKVGGGGQYLGSVGPAVISKPAVVSVGAPIISAPAPLVAAPIAAAPVVSAPVAISAPVYAAPAPVVAPVKIAAAPVIAAPKVFLGPVWYGKPYGFGTRTIVAVKHHGGSVHFGKHGHGHGKKW